MTDFMTIGILVCWHHPESSAQGTAHSRTLAVAVETPRTSCSTSLPVEHNTLYNIHIFDWTVLLVRQLVLGQKAVSCKGCICDFDLITKFQ